MLEFSELFRMTDYITKVCEGRLQSQVCTAFGSRAENRCGPVLLFIKSGSAVSFFLLKGMLLFLPIVGSMC